MNKRIGITTYFVANYELGANRPRGIKDQNMIMSTEDYSSSILNAGGIPLLIPPFLDEGYAMDIIKSVDALLLSGGGDINPKLYNQSVRKRLTDIEPRRDAFEIMLIDAAIKFRKPIFGICRGFQLLNVYFGGLLEQDLRTVEDAKVLHDVFELERFEKVHEVSIRRDSKLYKAVNNERIAVNSFHHQCIDKLGENLIPVAWSDDNIVEAFELDSDMMVFGVQWHPEMMTEKDEIQRLLFKFFINNI